MTVPTISVIVPAYNAEKTILETVRSIQAQTFSDFELIVINDGSKDGTVQVLEGIHDPRLKVFSYENGGLPVARNRGIDRSIGQYLSFVDADDLWTPDKLETQLAALQQNPAAGVAYSWTVLVDDQGNFLYKPDPIYYQGNIYARMLTGNFISSGSNILVRRDLVEAAGEFDPTLKSAEDWDYYLRLAQRTEFALVPKYQILYRRSSQSMTSKVDVMEKNILIVIDRAFTQAPAELQYLRPQTLSNTNLFFAYLCLTFASDEAGIRKAGEKLAKALRIYPKNLLQRKTLRFLAKYLVLRLFPRQVAAKVTQRLARFFPASTHKGTIFSKKSEIVDNS